MHLLCARGRPSWGLLSARVAGLFLGHWWVWRPTAVGAELGHRVPPPQPPLTAPSGAHPQARSLPAHLHTRPGLCSALHAHTPRALCLPHHLLSPRPLEPGPAGHVAVFSPSTQGSPGGLLLFLVKPPSLHRPPPLHPARDSGCLHLAPCRPGGALGGVDCRHWVGSEALWCTAAASLGPWVLISCV